MRNLFISSLSTLPLWRHTNNPPLCQGFEIIFVYFVRMAARPFAWQGLPNDILLYWFSALNTQNVMIYIHKCFRLVWIFYTLPFFWELDKQEIAMLVLWQQGRLWTWALRVKSFMRCAKLHELRKITLSKVKLRKVVWSCVKLYKAVWVSPGCTETLAAT